MSNQMKLDDIICPPFAPVLMESTRAIGYSLESAIADVIDNSIAANAANVWIFFNIDPRPHIAIIDDGNGMNSEQITNAMRYGAYNPNLCRRPTDLGRYGLGMKTASLSQCRILSVISKQNGALVGRRWDLDYIISTQQWNLQCLGEEEIAQIVTYECFKNIHSGTIVLWQNLDKFRSELSINDMYLDQKMSEVKNHLELTFHRYLSGDGVKKLQIHINNVKLSPFDPFFESRSQITMDDEKIEVPGRQGIVVVRPYLLPHPSNLTQEELDKYGGKDGLRNSQGFYIYRNKRLITSRSWFNLIKKDEFTKLARVRVDIPNSLDDLWTLDIKKSTATPPELVKTRLKQLIGKLSDGSKRSMTFRQKKEVKKGISHVWEKIETREGVRYLVNMHHPTLELIEDRLDNDTRMLLRQYLDTVQNNLPFNNLHHDLCSDIKIVQDNVNNELSRVLFLAKEMIKLAIQKNNLKKTIDMMAVTEPFMNYMSEIHNLIEDCNG